jgi:hypothetical protein
MGLRWFRDRTTVDALARDHGETDTPTPGRNRTPLGATVWCPPEPGVMPGRPTGADNDLGSSDLEVLHVSESGSPWR